MPGLAAIKQVEIIHYRIKGYYMRIIEIYDRLAVV